MLGDNRAGPFKLEVEWVKVVRAEAADRTMNPQ